MRKEAYFGTKAIQTGAPAKERARMGMIRMPVGCEVVENIPADLEAAYHG